MMKAIIVDDEPLARMRLKRLLSGIGVEVVAEGENGQDAINLVTAHTIDLLFIDINMPVKNGLNAVIELGNLMDELPAIIFCTAYDEYALDAFKTCAVDYLLKPIQSADIKRAVDKASTLTRVQLGALQNSQKNPETLTVHIDGVIQKTSIDEFVCFKAIEKNVFAVTLSGEELLIDNTLKVLESSFNESLIRIHRSTLVNKKYLKSLSKDESGAANLNLSVLDLCLAVSRRHLSGVKKCFA